MTTPRSYAEWRTCITVDCGIALTPAYVETRLATLRDDGAAETRRFATLYGEAHLRNVIGWFERAAREVV